MTDNERVLDILGITQGHPNAVWIIADALRRSVNPELGSVALAIAGIAMDRTTDPDATEEEIAAANWAASAGLMAAADDVLCEHQFDTMPHIERPHGDRAPQAPMFRSARVMPEAAE